MSSPSPPDATTIALRRFRGWWLVSAAVKIGALALFLYLLVKITGGS
ncbi:MAG: hypothetical protein WAN74_01805 [Thermoplasmata archaeon]